MVYYVIILVCDFVACSQKSRFLFETGQNATNIHKHFRYTWFSEFESNILLSFRQEENKLVYQYMYFLRALLHLKHWETRVKRKATAFFLKYKIIQPIQKHRKKIDKDFRKS